MFTGTNNQQIYQMFSGKYKRALLCKTLRLHLKSLKEDNHLSDLTFTQTFRVQNFGIWRLKYLIVCLINCSSINDQNSTLNNHWYFNQRQEDRILFHTVGLVNKIFQDYSSILSCPLSASSEQNLCSFLEAMCVFGIPLITKERSAPLTGLYRTWEKLRHITIIPCGFLHG